jgi:hypothetical protein
MNKKMILIGVAVLVVLAGLGGGLYYVFGAKPATTEEETKNKKRVSEPENILPVAERPVIYLVPKADGRNIDIVIHEVKKEATDAEYTLEYQTGTLVQAQENIISLASLPATETVFLGSCSAGGKCTFHEDIGGGSLRTRFAGDQSYVLRQDWKYLDNIEKESAFSSKDAFFQIESEDLASQRYLIIFNNPGYPEGLEGTPASDPYVIQGSSALSGTANLTIRATQEGSLSIMGWDGEEWHEFTGTVDGKSVTAEVDLMDLYIAVTK